MGYIERKQLIWYEYDESSRIIGFTYILEKLFPEYDLMFKN